MMLFLTGLPGSGKTWWSQQLAAALRWIAIDLDTEIERHCHATIPALFSIGEEHFRQKEQAILEQLIRENQNAAVIIATGGGTPCFYQNLDLMKSAGNVIYLKRTIQDLTDRIRRYPVPRPLLPTNADQLKDTLQKMELERSPFYEKAHLTIKPEGLTCSDWISLLQHHSLLPKNLQYDV